MGQTLSFIQLIYLFKRINLVALIQEDAELDNLLTSTQVKIIREGFQVEIKRG